MTLLETLFLLLFYFLSGDFASSLHLDVCWNQWAYFQLVPQPSHLMNTVWSWQPLHLQDDVLPVIPVSSRLSFITDNTSRSIPLLLILSLGGARILDCCSPAYNLSTRHHMIHLAWYLHVMLPSRWANGVDIFSCTIRLSLKLTSGHCIWQYYMNRWFPGLYCLLRLGNVNFGPSTLGQLV